MCNSFRRIMLRYCCRQLKRGVRFSRKACMASCGSPVVKAMPSALTPYSMAVSRSVVIQRCIRSFWSDSRGAMLSDTATYGLRLRQQLGKRYSVVDQAITLSPGGIPAISGEEEFLCTQSADQVDHQGSFDHRRNADLDFRHAEDRALCRDDDITANHQFQSCPQASAVDCRNHWLFHAPYLLD